MANIPKRLLRGFVSSNPASPSISFAVASKSFCKGIILNNTSNNFAKVTIAVVPTGATFDASTHIVTDMEISGKVNLYNNDTLVLETGDKIYLLCDTPNAVTAYIGAVETGVV
ncbi:hypothetical protein [Brevibacillus centrosporus]|uniref:hypothetical protein n=1 Tax=Brevibacillus centrosporus TaxID=54910 RepID=UPI003B01B725